MSANFHDRIGTPMEETMNIDDTQEIDVQAAGTEGEGEPGQVTDSELGVPGDAEPMPEADADAPDDGPDELGEQDTSDDAPVEIDPAASDDVDAGAGVPDPAGEL